MKKYFQLNSTHLISSRIILVFTLIVVFVVVTISSCINYNPPSATDTTSKNYDYIFKVMISEEKMR